MKTSLIRPATQADALHVAENLRVRDAMAEIWALQGKTRAEAVCHTFDTSAVRWTWEVDGVAACMWGVIAAPGKNIAWLLTTDAVERHARGFWRRCAKAVAEMLSRFGRVEGYCDARFILSVRWLKRLGFRVGAPFAVGDILLHHFEMEG